MYSDIRYEALLECVAFIGVSSVYGVPVPYACARYSARLTRKLTRYEYCVIYHMRKP